MAVIILLKGNAAVAATPHPAHYIRHLLLKEKAFGWPPFPAYATCCIPPHPSRCGSTPCPQFGIVVFEQIIVQILVASLSQPPRASALRQARVSGGNLQNCAPSAACGGAYAPALFCHWQGRYSGSRLGEGFYSHAVSKRRRYVAAFCGQRKPSP